MALSLVHKFGLPVADVALRAKVTARTSDGISIGGRRGSSLIEKQAALQEGRAMAGVEDRTPQYLKRDRSTMEGRKDQGRAAWKNAVQSAPGFVCLMWGRRSRGSVGAAAILAWRMAVFFDCAGWSSRACASARSAVDSGKEAKDQYETLRKFPESSRREWIYIAAAGLALSWVSGAFAALCESPPNFINYQTTGAVLGRLHGIKRAFATVSKEADGRTAREAINWKMRVRHALEDEIDARTITENNTGSDSIDKEVRGRQQQKALLPKPLDNITGSGEGAGGE